ncbi:DNA-binding transcriptional response regulator, NtrC family, contains REC, AAA-type ATPase, and a Fis-type DNA-binding domains [Kushneria avicenniae]|uniref:DNA-binding transcriptional response regulator, NtrC family, contains REC, AAA-type ATPase, and a Fis-type DNA-binding domains n=1 Tax=Kushneria avicenniae TaxID=402385 RepID=A0A1I1IB31_9GAMM|nr:sigma-54 dependent transcriptional regulator [Kushneria avicenniae]SFC33417.1 DNA-binding transcriptional response regulator, NtrC family, contains REC, AAA-type ATPase, and a Fis-type DNA-binding domains [Kushneria avicenniae]
MTDRILIVEDDPAILELLTEELEEAGHIVTGVDSAEQALLHDLDVDVIISDIRLPGMDGMTLLETLVQQPDHPAVIIITAFGSIDQAVDALQRGADDFLTKPLDLDQVRGSVARLSQHRRLKTRQQTRQTHGICHLDELTSCMPAMAQLFDQARRLAAQQAAVLIQGESGTGKELLAHALHREGPRHSGPFVAVNCASIAPDVMESECFGHVKGAFTGAIAHRRGLFQQAHGGTLFLDEIGDMPLALQAKLLRVLQTHRVRPVGSEEEQQIDIRIVAATNRPLDALIESGLFREDLFYRLETFSLTLPPLRERPDDIALLAEHFIERYSREQGHGAMSLSPTALSLLRAYPFPGNVRELDNAILRAVTLANTSVLEPDDFPERFRHVTAGSDSQNAQTQEWLSLEQMEQRYIQRVLDAVDGNKRRAADILGIGRKTLYRRLEARD